MVYNRTQHGIKGYPKNLTVVMEIVAKIDRVGRFYV